MKSRFLAAVLMALATPCLAQGPVPSYYTYLTQTINSSNLITQTVLISGTTTGSCYYTCGTGTCTIPNCPNATHTPTVCNEIAGTGTCTVGPVYSMFTQMNYQTTITFQAQPGVLYNGTDSTSIYCTMGGAGFQSGGGSFQLEGALTQAYWNGTPIPSCSKLCTYAVHNNCTAATTPPDLNMVVVNSSNYVGIATYVSWMNAAVCIRFGIVGPWTCTSALSFVNSVNVTMPPYSCTHNP